MFACVMCLCVPDNLENGWMDFLFAHYVSRLTHGLLRFAKSDFFN